MSLSLLLLLLLLSSHSCRVLTLVYLKQTMFPGSTVLQQFCSYNSWHMYRYLPYWMFCTFTSAPSEVRVQCPVWLLHVLPGMMRRYLLNDSEMVPVAHIIIFTFHVRYISIVRCLYFRIFSASFFITFLSSEIAASKCPSIWLPYFHFLFLLILVLSHTSVLCISLHMLKCRWAHALSRILYSYFANIE